MKSAWRRATIVAAGVLTFLLWSASASAEFFEIKSYDTKIVVDSESVLNVEEVIDVVFSEPRHGIFRKVPYQYKRADSLLTYDTSLFGIEVPGEKFEVSRSGGYVTIKIGSANETVSGERRYVIRYKVYGGVKFLDGFDEFYWNVIGHDWETGIERATFSVSLPPLPPGEPLRHAVHTGRRESTASKAVVSMKGGVLQGHSTAALGAGEGITVAIMIPKGVLVDGSLALRLRLFAVSWAIAVVPAVCAVFLYLLWFVVGRDEKVTSMVFFKPPARFSPAEAGVILDETADRTEVLSLIPYWATKGVLSIGKDGQDSDSSPLSPDYTLHKLKDLSADAKQYEKTLFGAIFSGSDEVRLSELKTVQMRKAVLESGSQLQAAVAKSSLYVAGSQRLKGLVLAVGLGIAVVAGYIFHPGVGLTTVVPFFVFGPLMTKKTREGLQALQEVQGFKEFMQRAEAPRLKVLLAEDPNYFDATIPYAVAFGFAAAWADKFDGLLAAAPAWYSSGLQHDNSFHNFGSSFDSCMATMGSAFSTSSSSSSDSGGGFSGGGGGGGGGGSW